MTVSDIQSGTKAAIKAVSLRPIIVIHSLAQHSDPAFSLLLPPLKPSRGKSVKLEVDEDKSTKGSNFPSSEVTIGLSPYTFPQECPFHVPREENIAWAAATEIRALQ